MIIRTPDYRLHVFVSSTLKELAEERKVVRQAILKLRLAPVMFESGARPHPAQDLYKSYLSQSQVFIGIYWQNYGWVAPEMKISGLEDEYNLSAGMPRLIYIKNPAQNREPDLTGLLDRIRSDNSASYTYFSSPAQLRNFVENDLALLLTEHFEAARHDEHPLEASVANPPTNLPVPRNPLINRENEMASACDLLRRDDIALVTLTGPGGTGKSRLALQVGLDVLDCFKDGVYLVRLEAINNPDLVIPAIAETLNLRESTGSVPVSELLRGFLRDKQILLILDNFEQVVEAAPSVTDLLEACPRLKCIVTSRAPLRLRPEKELPVPPLSIPSQQKSSSVDNLSQYAAVELFIQRAQAVKPDFTVTNANAPAVAEICSCLDGLPLAIELAAARIKLLTPQGLLSRLGHRFDLLTSGTRDLPERQRTLRGAIDWSFNLLNDMEKKLFRRLSVFAGGCSLDAVEVVCDIDGDLSHHLEDTLAALIDNNLVIPHQEYVDEPRFGMLSTIHDYALERLAESDESDTVHSQFIRFVLDFVTRVEPLVRTSERIHWQQVMQQEFGNIRGALEWVCQTKKCIDTGQKIVTTIGVFWMQGGHIAEGQQWCSKFLAFCDDSTPTTIRAGLMCYESQLAWAQGDQLSAIDMIDKSVDLCRQQADKGLLTTALMFRAIAASGARDLETAAEMFQEALDIARINNDIWYQALISSWLGDVALYQNDPIRASALHDESIRLARSQGDPWCLMPALMSTAQIAMVGGDLATAHKNLVEVVGLMEKTDDHWSLSWTLIDLGHVAFLQDDLNQARSYILEGLSLGKTLGNLRVLIIALAEAAALIARQSQNGDQSSQTLAAQICGATAPYIDTPGMFIWFDTKKLYDDAVNQAKSLISADVWEQGYLEGQSIPLEQAIALAIQAFNQQN